MNANGILRGRLSWWRCFPLERNGLMPCDSCECFDMSTFECVQPGGRISSDVLDLIRDLYVKDQVHLKIHAIGAGFDDSD